MSDTWCKVLTSRCVSCAVLLCCCGLCFRQVCEGETISGVLSCKPNASNPRDLDISLEYHFEGKHCEAHRTQVGDILLRHAVIDTRSVATA